MAATSPVRVVDEIEAVLYFLGPPARIKFAPELRGLGLRLHPELATLELEQWGPKWMGNHAPAQPVRRGDIPLVKTSKADSARRVAEVVEIAKVLYFLNPAARRECAAQMHGLGARVHPELATLELELLGPKKAGSPARTVPKKGVYERSLDIVEHADPAMAARIRAANTAQDRREAAAEALAKYERKRDAAQRLAEQTDPQDLN